MERSSPSLEKALLEWVNILVVSKKITKWTEFQDGRVLWRILVDVDSEYFSGDLPEGDTDTSLNWIPRWQNLKHIDRSLRQYLSEKLNKLPQYSKTASADLKAIAEHGASTHIVQILKLVMYAAVVSPTSVQRQLALFEKLDKNTSNTLIEMIKDMDDSDQKLAVVGVDQDVGSDVDAPTSRPESRNLSVDRTEPIERDPELEYEEKLIQARRRARDLETTVENLERELSQSRNLITNLEEQLNDTRFSVEREIEEKQARERLAQLSAKELSDRTVIADLETDLNEAKSQIETQKRQIDRLNNDATAKQELRDQIQMLQLEKDELVQKTKANENLKKKIQSLQDVDRKYQSLLQDSEESRTRLEEYERLQKRCEGLQQANNENIRVIQNLEQQLLTSEERRRILQQEKKLTEHEAEQARDLHQRQMEANEELKAQVREMQSGAVPQNSLSNLDDELAAHEDSEILNETSKIDLGDEHSPENFVLSQKLQMSLDQNERIKERWLKAVEENQGLLNSIKKLEDVEQTDPFIKQRTKLLEVEKELESLRAERLAASVENSELRAQVTEFGPDHGGATLDAASQDKFDAVQANLNKTIAEYKRFKEQYEGVTADLHDTKGLLNAVIALKAGDESLSETDYARIIADELDAIEAAEKAERPELRKGFANKLAAQLQSSRERVANVNKRLEQSATAYESMRKDLEQAKKDGGLKAGDAAHKELEQLQRENDLMTSAWYSITSRLQSNTVVLARRTEAPKSWIRRQQAVVGGAHSSRR